MNCFFLITIQGIKKRITLFYKKIFMTKKNTLYKIVTLTLITISTYWAQIVHIICVISEQLVYLLP